MLLRLNVSPSPFTASAIIATTLRIRASAQVGAPADLRHTHNATVKRTAFCGIRAGVGETWGGKRVQLDLVRMAASLPVLLSAL
jgi:hypothetical protein